MSRASTGFSRFPFEQAYRTNIRAPLEVLREAWEGSRSTDESVVLHVIATHGDGKLGAGEHNRSTGDAETLVRQESKTAAIRGKRSNACVIANSYELHSGWAHNRW